MQDFYWRRWQLQPPETVRQIDFIERKQVEAVESGANEVMYKMAEFLLKKMQENGLISEEEREKITVLNIETFSPELAKVYL